MKKFIALILSLIMVLSLTACGGGNAPADSSDNSPNANGAAQKNGNPTLQVEITSPTTATLLISGVKADEKIPELRYEVDFDGKYAASVVDYGSEQLQCSIWVIEGDKGSKFDNATYEMGDGTVTIYADLSKATDFDFNNVKQYTLAIREDENRTKRTEFAAAEVKTTGLGTADKGDTNTPKEITFDDYLGRYELLSEGMDLRRESYIIISKEGEGYKAEISHEEYKFTVPLTVSALTDKSEQFNVDFTAEKGENNFVFTNYKTSMSLYYNSGFFSKVNERPDSKIWYYDMVCDEAPQKDKNATNENPVKNVKLEKDGTFTLLVEIADKNGKIKKDTLTGKLPDKIEYPIFVEVDMKSSDGKMYKAQLAPGMDSETVTKESWFNMFSFYVIDFYDNYGGWLEGYTK